MHTASEETSAPARASGTFAIGGELSVHRLGSEEFIAEALHPYPEGLVIATKGGLRRGGHPDGRPEHCERTASAACACFGSTRSTSAR